MPVDISRIFKCIIKERIVLDNHLAFKTINMIQKISGLADNVAGFRAGGVVNKDDYDKVIYPEVKRIAEKSGELNFLMVMDTDMKNFTWGAWVDDALLGLKHLTKWHRIAFVADSDTVNKVGRFMNRIAPGEYKGFAKANEAEAINWVQGQTA
jgi:hypothetical protein